MTPKPITREDMYYDYLINGGDVEKLPKPITRKEIYLYYLCTNGFAGSGGTGEGGTTNYNSLSNKPKINGMTLQGNLSTEDIDITIPEELPNPYPVNFDGMLLRQTYDGSKAVNVVFPDVEILNETAGTPVGEIISYMGLTAPPNYLICDGTEYQIADYPYLSQHFVDNFGSVNYFGGNGENSFAVPDLRGEFLRGTGTAERDTGSGADVGEHQNGTEMVNFGVFNNASSTLQLYSHSTEKFSASSEHDKVIDKNVGGTQLFNRGSIYAQPNLVARYTSRPTNTSVLYCIKYKPTYFARIEAESEENA